MVNKQAVHALCGTSLTVFIYLVVRIMLGAVSAQMVFDQDVMKRSRLIMDKSYSWPWAVPEVSTKKRQSQQGEGGCLSCGSDDGCRIAVVAGALSYVDCAIRLQKPAMGCSAYAPPRAASVRSARRGLHSACPKPPAPGALCHVLPPASLPEAAPVAPSAGRRR